MRRCRIYVSGHVQGIGYRSFTKKRATEIGLSGFARNLPDGRVEIIVEGDETRIHTFVERLKEGPWGSRVSNTEIRWEKPSTEFTTFEVKL